MGLVPALTLPAKASTSTLPPPIVRMAPVATVMLFPAKRLMEPSSASIVALPASVMLPVPDLTVPAAAVLGAPGTTVLATLKFRPASRVTDQPASAVRLAPRLVPIKMLPPASKVSWLPGVLTPVLLAKSQVTPSERVMLPVACRSICENPVNAEFTFNASAPGVL